MNPDLLSQLRDIHAAPEVSWWPPAPGWWLLALIVLLVLGWLMQRAVRYYRNQQRRKQMLAWVDHLNGSIDPQKEPQAYLSTLNRIFKLVALRAFPEQHCAALAGQVRAARIAAGHGARVGIRFLVEKMGDMDSGTALDALASGPYDPAPSFDPDVMNELTRSWIRQHG